jgi:hypothetical protein
MVLAVRTPEDEQSADLAVRPAPPPPISFRTDPPGDGCVVTQAIRVRTGPIGAWLNRREFDAVRAHMREEGENLKRTPESGTLRSGGETAASPSGRLYR